MPDVNIFIAFGAGLLSFISPCVLPLYPAFLSYITGMSIEEINTNQKSFNKKSLIHTIAFLVGFSLVFIVIGFSTNFVSRSEEHTSELQSRGHLVCRLLLEKKKIHIL